MKTRNRNTYYIGATTNLFKRVKEHAIKGYDFESIVACHPCNTFSEALKLESFLKYCYKIIENFPILECGGINDTQILLRFADEHPKARTIVQKYGR